MSKKMDKVVEINNKKSNDSNDKIKYSKKEILKSECFSLVEKDFLKVWLSDEKMTIKAVVELIINKGKGVVK